MELRASAYSGAGNLKEADELRDGADDGVVADRQGVGPCLLCGRKFSRGGLEFNPPDTAIGHHDRPVWIASLGISRIKMMIEGEDVALVFEEHEDLARVLLKSALVDGYGWRE